MSAPSTEPLYSLEMEQAALMQAVSDRVAALKLCALLDESDFHLTAHKRIFSALQAIVQTQEPCPILALPQELKKRGQMEEVGTDYLIDTIGSGYYQGPESLAHYAERVADDGHLRWLADTCQNIARDCQTRKGTAEELRSQLISALVGKRRATARGPVRFGEVRFNELQRIIERRQVPALGFGIPELDNFCGGLENGEVGIIAGKPATGKTALVHQMSSHAAKEWGTGLIFSLEVARNPIVRRQLARVSGFSYRELRTLQTWSPHIGAVQLSDSDIGRIVSSSDELAHMDDAVWIEDQVSALDRVIAVTHELHAETKLTWVAIDYGQLVEVRRAEKRNIEVEAVTRACKNQIATALQIPVWMISSLTKAGMTTKSADMNDLAESASLQFTAGMIGYLEGDGDLQADGSTPVKMNIVKCRNDAAGEVKLLFYKARFLLTGRTDLDKPPPPFPTYGPGDPFADEHERGIR